MDLDERTLDRQQRVAQRDACMRQPTGVDDRDVEVPLVEPIDQGALVVGLEEVDAQVELGSSGRNTGVDLVERLAPVNLRFARAHEVQVRAF